MGGKLNIFRYVSVSATMSEQLWIRVSAVGLWWWFGPSLSLAQNCFLLPA